MVENITRTKSGHSEWKMGWCSIRLHLTTSAKTEGIMRHHTVWKTPHQSRVAEQINQTLIQHAQCMKLSADLLE